MIHYNILYIRNGDVIFIIILNWNQAPSFSYRSPSFKKNAYNKTTGFCGCLLRYTKKSTHDIPYQYSTQPPPSAIVSTHTPS